MTTPVLVTGCHRGGTSALARALHALGLQLGPAPDLKPPAPDNPDGFWEHAPLVAVSDELLARLGGGWDCAPQLPDTLPSTPELDTVRASAREALVRLEAGVDAGPWGWKDPRLCVTLPFWLELLPDAPVIVCLRNPLEVAVSLHERNGISHALALQLWADHHRRVIAAVPAERRTLVHYDALLSADASAHLRRLAVAIGLEPDEDRLASAAEVLDASARHTRLGWQDLRQVRASAELIRTYEILLAEAGWLDDADRTAARTSDVRPADSAVLPAGGVGSLDAGALDRLVLTHRYHRRGGHIAILQRRLSELEQAGASVAEPTEPIEPDGIDVADLLAEFERTFHRAPSLLDWHSGLGIFDRFPDRDVMLPRVGLDALPHADRSVDLVAVGSYEPALLAEATRVARAAVLVGLPNGDPAWSRVDVRWQDSVEAPARPRLSILVVTSAQDADAERVAGVLSAVPPEHVGEIVAIGGPPSPVTAGAGLVWSPDPAPGLASAFDGADGDVVFVVDEGVHIDGDWVTPMLRLLAQRDDLGAVIGRVMHDDQVLAAGAELRADASVRYLVPPGGEPSHPDGCFVRTTDLHGGSVVAMRRRCAVEVGGIAPSYETAGAALTDLGLALQGAGWGVLLQPDCVVRSRVPAPDASAVVADRARLLAKWAPVLAQRAQVTTPAGEQ